MKKNKVKKQAPPPAAKQKPAPAAKHAEVPAVKAVTRIEINGFNQARILNRLTAQNIVLKNITRVSPKLLRLEIAKKDCTKVFAILQEMCYNYSVLSESGLRQFFKACARHAGFIAGAVVFISAILFINSMVWRVDIGGNQTVASQIIAKELAERGVKTGVFKHNIDLDAIAASLRDVDGLAEVTAELRGTTVYVRVLEQKDYVAPDYDNEPRDITSAYDAVVTRIVAERGVTAVKTGDAVKAGATLIKGEVYDINGELLETCRARGKVYGRVAFSSTHIISDTEYYHERTGKKQTFTAISLFSLKIGKKKQPDWQKIISEEKLFLIPIKVTRTVCYETELKQRPRDVTAYVETLKNEAVLQNVIKAGGSQLETITTLTPMENGLIMLNIHILAEMEIGG